MMRIADLFCGAGGAAMGLHRAGFEVVGFDIEPQPHYPFEFHQADALEVDLSGFDAVWASPPCQAYTRFHKLNLAQATAGDYPDLIGPTRQKLEAVNRPFIIENVPGSPLRNTVQLCGSWFGLRLHRHRLFESSVTLWGTPCAHHWQRRDLPPLHRLVGHSAVVGVYGHGRGAGDDKAAWSEAMDIDWMTRPELTEAVPPAYSEYLGRQVIPAMP